MTSGRSLQLTLVLALGCGDDAPASDDTESGTSTTGTSSTSSSTDPPPDTSTGPDEMTSSSTGSGGSSGTDGSSGSSSSGGSSSESTAAIEPGCGNGVLEPPEECDLGEANGTGLGCKDNCETNFCQDGYHGPGEQCDDGNDLDDDACLSNCVLATCGDGFIQTGVEDCDAANLAGESCESLGFGSGDLDCNLNCVGFDNSGCQFCGNDVIDEGEDCDGTDLDGETCFSLGFPPGGTLACEPDCMDYDTTLCI